jgi:heme-degrading monooxygenase HmoA
MQLAHAQLTDIMDGRFYRLMGSGAGNGFSIWPDWSTYALLVKWNSKEEAQKAFEKHSYLSEYKERSVQHQHVYLSPFKTHGSWNGENPFEEELDEDRNGPIAVLTRATIKPHLVPYFWTKVRGSSKGIEKYPGHLYSKGVGEWPLFMQATISMWDSKEDMRRFAYESQQHQRVMKLTRTKGWYKEDMFTEFNVLGMEGNLLT